jgi:PHD/YefM family antitoxin component YafN of YafNO toxin-antitoxin module
MDTLHEQYIVDSKGKKTAVILPIDQYEQLLEDLHDLAIVAERRREKPISLDEMERRLKKDGFLRHSL